MTDIDTGLNVWQMTTNHNRMIEIQADRRPLTWRPAHGGQAVDRT